MSAGYCFMGPYENCEGYSIVRDDPQGGDPITIATLKRIHRPDELHELCRLANQASAAEKSSTP